MSKITIQVSEQNIKEGVASNCEYCPIALAIRKLIKKEFHVQVRSDCIELLNRSILHKIILLPKRAQNFIMKFDGIEGTGLENNHRKLKPFEFKVNISEKYLV